MAVEIAAMAVDGVLNFLLTKLDYFIRKNWNLLKGVKEEVQEMKSELVSIKTFLARAPDSSIEEAEPDGQLQLWINDLRGLAYDIEDVLDEFTLAQEDHPLKKVLKIPKRYDVGKKVEDIKRRLHKICERKDRYSNNQWSIPPANGRWQDPRDAFRPSSKDEIVGIGDQVNELKAWLRRPDLLGPAMISVVGMAGLGKTTLVKQLYDDEEVKGWFECRAWIKLSPSRKINGEHYRRMMVEFTGGEGIDSMRDDQLMLKLKNFLNRRRYVLILDDIWDTSTLADIRNELLCHGAVGSRIIATTRILNVEKYSEVYRLNPLPLQEAWNLFCKKALPLNFQGESHTDQLEELSWKIVERWQGLPLAIVLVGSLLKSKDMNLMEWNKVHSDLASESANKDYKNAMKLLSFSYNCLPYNLKSCLLHLGIFPEGQAIKRMRLIRLWMAEGFLETNDHKTMEEVAGEYLNQLTNHSVIEVAQWSNYGRVISYKVHPLMREFLVSKSKEVNFCALCTNKIVANTEEVRRLSIHEGVKNLDSITLSHVRSFFASRVDKSSITSRIFCKFTFLKVLDLEDAPLNNFPETLTKLFFLRYLSLENTKIGTLPRSIGELVNLETLNLKGTFVSKLPHQICKLQNMRHLLVYRHDKNSTPFCNVKAVKLPWGIDRLTTLQKLSYIKANSKRGTISEMGKLTQLRRLGVVGLRRKDGSNLCASIAKMTHLLSFTAHSVNANELLDLEHLKTSPPSLQGLHLQGRLKKLPQWISSLQNLARLTLGWSRLEEDPFPFLSRLPALVQLEIIEAYVGALLNCGQYNKGEGFPKLKSLLLVGLHRLESINVREEAMATLEKLEIRCCGALQMFRSSIGRLPKLQELILFDMPAFVVDLKRQRDQVTHIKRIYTYDSSSGRGTHL